MLKSLYKWIPQTARQREFSQTDPKVIIIYGLQQIYKELVVELLTLIK